MQSNQTFRTLELSFCKIEDESMCRLAHALKQQQVIMTLFICVYLFCHLFTQALMVLEVRENKISDHGAEYLGKMLQNNQVCR